MFSSVLYLEIIGCGAYRDCQIPGLSGHGIRDMPQRDYLLYHSFRFFQEKTDNFRKLFGQNGVRHGSDAGRTGTYPVSSTSFCPSGVSMKSTIFRTFAERGLAVTM